MIALSRPVALELTLDMNGGLANTTAAYESPTVVYSTFVSDGYGMFSFIMVRVFFHPSS
jgi:hypothetical protein